MSSRSPLSASDALSALRLLHAHARASGQRALAWLAGERALHARLVRDLLAGTPAVAVHWHGDVPPSGVRSSQGREALRCLGGECDLLVFDAWSGFDPDALGALVGTLRAGGLLLLLSPAARDWPAFDDPENIRVCVEPFSARDVGRRYLTRLAQGLLAAPDVLCIEAGRRVQASRALDGVVAPAAPACVVSPAVESPCATVDQQRAVEAVVRVALGHRRRPLVLQADRGRGKSAALGIAAARLVRGRGLRVLVTAPRRSAVEALFRHAAQGLDSGQMRQLQYVPPDQALADAREADLVLVDEAAAIGLPVLEGLLRRWPRLVFSTTVQGYEGSGRGFALRFSRMLGRACRQWHSLELQTPVRWRPDDRLEPRMNALLMLDARPALFDSAGPVGGLVLEVLDRDRLAGDESALRELFGLLVEAHYKTRPFDLRQLLDGPNIQLLVARWEGRLAGAALVAREGGFDAATAGRIAAGERRPRGHLLPETLAVHLGLGEAPRLDFARVMRIVVHPALQGRGVGTALLGQVEREAHAAGCALVGSAFGATPRLLAFWQCAGWQPVRVSERRGAASGCHSVVVLRPLTGAGKDLHDRARRRFLRHFPHQLGDGLRTLEAELVVALMRGAPAAVLPLGQEDVEDVRRFACDLRFPEAVAGSLWTWLHNRLLSPASLDVVDVTDRALLIARLLQHRDWSTCARLAGEAGRKAVLARMRAAVRRLLEADEALDD